MSGTSYMAMKAQSESKQADDKRQQERRKATLVLIIKHLVDYGYVDSAEKLQSEGSIAMGQFEAADNMDLLTIVTEFEAYYEMKFGKKPKLMRKSSGDGSLPKLPTSSRSSSTGAKKRPPKPPGSSSDDDGATGKAGQTLGSGMRPKRSSSAPLDVDATKAMGGGMSIGGKSMAMDDASGKHVKGKAGRKEDDPDSYFDNRLIKPLPDFGGNTELRELAASIQRDIWTTNPDVRWSDIAANDTAKRLLKEAVVMPIQYPQLFTGLLAPWKGVLLYGPPGTGKTMLAKAVATECKTTFFNISASSIVSKWRGDSEKLVRVLFELARYHAPSTIFLDEIDSIMSKRDGSGNEHEGSRRMKTELLIQMDGLTASNEQVFVLAASNLPWDLDAALLRRLEKRIFVGLPGEEARDIILKKHLEERVERDVNITAVAKRTESYSGSDLVLLAKECAMRPMRRLMKMLEGNPTQEKVVLGKVSAEDVAAALSSTKPSAVIHQEKYEKWTKGFSSQ